MKYQVPLLERKEIAEGTMAFHFEKPSGFTFKAGQHIVITLSNPPETDAEGNNRIFTIASTPHEKDLMVATRMRDTAFKRSLKILPLGTKVELEGPYGSFVLHNDTARPAVFLMGGIGITPARSIILDATVRKLPHALSLFYSNRTPEDAPFLKELMDLGGHNPNFTFIGTMTDMAQSHTPWSGATGYIDKAMLMSHFPDATKPIYYLAGPLAMANAMHELLYSLGVNDDNIRLEEFTGY